LYDGYDRRSKRVLLPWFWMLLLTVVVGLRPLFTA
jgi:hypothetical protein